MVSEEAEEEEEESEGSEGLVRECRQPVVSARIAG